ncbi:MAG: PAS domain S-box protein, partial [Dehalococcoidales bacterium]|nr:PAS domain S-box protein [Dehalococcoidales bacterium]
MRVNRPLQSEVAEHRRTEAALRATERKYQELVENVNSIILRMDTTGRVTFWNEFAERFFGFAEAEIVGRNVVGTIVPETDAAGQDLAQMIRDIGRYPERYASNENENVRANGERVWVAWTNKAILDDNGQTTEILCVGNDITAIKRTDEELRRARGELELRVEERTAQLMQANQALQQQIAERERVEEALRLAYQTLEQRVAERTRDLSMLLSIQQAITSPLDPEATLQVIAEEACRLTSARRAFVLLLEGEDLHISVIAGENGKHLLGLRVPAGSSAAGEAIRMGQPVNIQDAQTDPRTDQGVIGQTGVRTL